MVDRVMRYAPLIILAAILFKVHDLRSNNRVLSGEISALQAEKAAADVEMQYWRQVGRSLLRNTEAPLVFDEPTLVYAFDPNCAECWDGLAMLEDYGCTAIEVVATSVSGGHEIPNHVITDVSSDDWERLPLVPSSAALYTDGRIRVWRVMTESMDEIRSVAC